MEDNCTVPSVALVPVPEEDAVLIAFKGEISRLLEYAEKANVTDLATAKDATNDIATCRTIAKAIEDTRKRYKAPIIAEGKRVDAFFDTLTAPLKQADQTYSGKVQTWKTEEDRKIAEAKRLNDLAEEKARIERDMAERKAREDREAAERNQKEAEELADRLNAPPPPPLPPPIELPPPEPPKFVEVPDEQKHVRSEAGMLGFTQVIDKEKVQAAIDLNAKDIQMPTITIPGLVIWAEWQFKVLDIKKVPAEFKKSSNRITR
jgi:hypothetical protein